MQHPECFGLTADDLKNLTQNIANATAPERVALVARIREESSTAPCFLDGNGIDEAIFIRGNPHKLGQPVPRRFLDVFSSGESKKPASDRLTLAQQMIDPQRTPILPRVIVNRIWQHDFGRGIVPTPDDFGHMGELPTHPELLDDLAQTLIESGWSLKKIHREILLSATYRMRSSGSPATTELQDPKNEFLHRMRPKRLEGEIIRDAILAVSGRLDDAQYGRSVPIHLTAFLDGRGRPGVSGPVDGNGRRSVYLAVRRNFPEPLLAAFDLPTPTTSRGRRSISNVPAQALALLNNPFVLEQAQLWQARYASLSPAERITQMYIGAYGRKPTSEELSIAEEYVANESNTRDAASVWTDLAQVLINAKEFVFVP